jgi:hypothetical protein
VVHVCQSWFAVLMCFPGFQSLATHPAGIGFLSVCYRPSAPDKGSSFYFCSGLPLKRCSAQPGCCSGFSSHRVPNQSVCVPSPFDPLQQDRATSSFPSAAWSHFSCRCAPRSHLFSLRRGSSPVSDSRRKQHLSVPSS